MAGKKGQKRIKPNDESPRHYEYYQKQHPEWTEQQCIDACNYFKKTKNYQCIEFYQTHYPDLTLEEQEKMLKEKVSKKNSPQTFDYWRNKYPNCTKEEIQKKYTLYQREHNYQCIEYYQKHYPDLTDDERLVLLNNKIKHAGKIISSKVSGELNGMHHHKTTEIQRKQISPKCIEFYEKKYPELSHEDHINLLNKQICKTNNSLTPEKRTTNIEYYINKGLTYEEATIALKNRQTTFTLEKCITKYGVEQGTIMFLNRQKQWINSLKLNFSKNGIKHLFQSKLALNIINNIEEFAQIKLELEHYIYDTKNNRSFSYDIKYNNKLIEINGDYWHCNPKFYTENYYNKNKQKYAYELWEDDFKKCQCAINNGYNILTIWENEYNNNQYLTIKKCIDFLIND